MVHVTKAIKNYSLKIVPLSKNNLMIGFTTSKQFETTLFH